MTRYQQKLQLKAAEHPRLLAELKELAVNFMKLRRTPQTSRFLSSAKLELASV